jgi:hypothetical protein
MNLLTERLRNYWSSTGVNLCSGASRQALKSFESTYGIRLPEDFHDFISTIDGMEDGYSDNNMVSFWPIDGIKSVPEKLITFAGIPDYSRIANRLREPDSYFVFADFLIWSHVYAIKLRSKLGEKNQVLWICGSEYRKIAESFSDFLQRYLDDPESLLIPVLSY